MTKPDVRRVLLEQADAIPHQDVAVLLSGGIDSNSALFALLEVGKKPTAYSFVLQGNLSTDFSLARRNAEIFGVPFISIILPVDIEQLKADVLKLQSLGARSKTDYECSWPMLYTYPVIEQPAIFSGLCADGHFCISKKGMIHYRNRIDEFRHNLYSGDRYSQVFMHRKLAAIYNKYACIPYACDDMKSEFLGTTWDEINRPRQKQPILDAFPTQFAKIHIRPHTNLQLGDSGIAQHFGRLLQTDWNARGYKSVRGIYNAVNAGSLN